MNHYFHHIGARQAFVVTAAAATLALAGCGKPPACGDDSTLGLLRSIVMDNVQKGLNTFEKDDPSGILAEFKRSIKITFSQIVSEGYKEDAKKQMCSARLRFQDMSKEGDEVRIEYSSQLTEDKDHSFAVQVKGAEPAMAALLMDAREHYTSNRWAGQWAGTYKCAGIDGATESPQAGFSQDVVLNVKADEANMQRSTRGGGYEKVGGNFLPNPDDSFTLELGGLGQNSPTDKWIAEFAGPVRGNKWAIDGRLRLVKTNSWDEDRILRNCKLELKKVETRT